MAKSSTKKTTRKNPVKALPWDHPAVLLSTWFGIGKLKFAPGTLGSLGALPVIAFVFGMTQGHNLFLWLLVATIIIFFAGLWASDFYSTHYGKKDPSEVVIDEVAGQMLAITFITFDVGPHVTAPHVIFPYLIIFLFFRFFDIWKPWPCSLFETKYKGGLGIMLDDIMAAVYALTLFYAIAVALMLFFTFSS